LVISPKIKKLWQFEVLKNHRIFRKIASTF